MEKNQMMLILRLVMGGYLVYLAYDLLQTCQGKGIFIAAAVLFALAGGALCIHSLLTLIRSGVLQNSPPTENGKESEDESENT